MSPPPSLSMTTPILINTEQPIRQSFEVFTCGSLATEQFLDLFHDGILAFVWYSSPLLVKAIGQIDCSIRFCWRRRSRIIVRKTPTLVPVLAPVIHRAFAFVRFMVTMLCFAVSAVADLFRRAGARGVDVKLNGFAGGWRLGRRTRLSYRRRWRW